MVATARLAVDHYRIFQVAPISTPHKMNGSLHPSQTASRSALLFLHSTSGNWSRGIASLTVPDPLHHYSNSTHGVHPVT